MMKLHPYVIDTLLPDLVGHDRNPAAFLVFLVLWRRSEGKPGDPVGMSLGEIAESSGLSKRAVQAAIERLVRRKLLTVHRRSITATGEYRVLQPWAAGPGS